MNYRIWYSTESFADYIIDNTNLQSKNIIKRKMYESDANNPNNFHSMPDHIKKILYLDAPDIIVEINSEPIFSIEVSTEAGTGHNAFQRFARLAASVENNVPAFYIYPEAAIITRQNTPAKWDKINPLVFKALDDVMSIYKIPALLYYFPSDFKINKNASNSQYLSSKGLNFDTNIKYAGSPNGSDPEMKKMFLAINEIIDVVENDGPIEGRQKLLSKRTLLDRRTVMQQEYVNKGGNLNMSPLSATVKIPTQYLLNYLSSFENCDYQIGELLKSRQETIVYKVDAGFRGDPYPGALAAIDYLVCREGKSFEERKYNLVMAWGEFLVDEQKQTIILNSKKSNINDFIEAVKASENKNILKKSYTELSCYEIPRYYMQVRYGSTFSKVKHIRVYSYFADAIIFPNGSLWRDA
jgi:hypothetical protein